MPTYNRGYIISRAIHSIIGQTFNNWILLIIDDGSRDNTIKRVAEMQEIDKGISKGTEAFRERIRYLQLYEHIGVSYARNCGLKNTICNYICFLDSDNYWSPNFLKSQLYAIKNSNTDMVYCKQRVALLDPETGNVVGQKERSYVTAEEEKKISSIDLNQIIIHRNVLKGVKCFDESLQRLVDWDFILRIFAKGYRVGYNDELLSTYFQNLKDSISCVEPNGSNAGRIMRKMKSYSWKPYKDIYRCQKEN